jgi:hypothetical protein
MLQEIFDGPVDVVENFAKKSDADIFSGVNRDNGRAAVRVSEEMMASFDPYHLKAGAAEDCNQFARPKTRFLGHRQTAMR